MRLRPILPILLALILLGSLGCERTLRIAARVQSLSPREAQGAPVILDVRAPEEYQAGHIPGALSVPAEGVAGYLSRCPLSMDQPLLLVCEHGKLSQVTGAEARGWHRGPLRDIAGGMEAWRQAGLPVVKGPGEAPPQALLATPVRVLSHFEQIITFVSGCIIKPTYMLASLLLILALRKRRGPLALLRWGLICFLVGETFCALDYALGKPGLLRPLDLIHGLGMALMGALAPWALFRLADERVLHYGDPAQTCTIQRFCGECWKRQRVPCLGHRLFRITLPALMLLSLIPLSAPLQTSSYTAQVLGSPVPFGSALFNEMVELWVYALLGILGFLVALLRLRGSADTRRAELPFFLGLGFSSFATFRFLLHNAFIEAQHGSSFWEEVTELVAILGLGYLFYALRGPLDRAGRDRVA